MDFAEMLFNPEKLEHSQIFDISRISQRRVGNWNFQTAGERIVV